MQDTETREVLFKLPGRSISLLVVKDVEKLITDPTDEDKVPCWAEIWPSARGLAHWLWDRLKFKNQEVLELGAGLGLPGLVCGLLGARVTFSDFNRSALELAQLNAARNGFTDFNLHHGDWRDFKLDQKFPWVVGSDIFYSPALNPPLKKVITNVLAPGGCLIAAHPGRPASFDFINQLKNENNITEEKTVVPITIDDPFFPYYEINIHLLKFL